MIYCIMDCTEAFENPGWDVEVFTDCHEARLAWYYNYDWNGTDSPRLRKYFREDLYGTFLTENRALEYVGQLKMMYKMTYIHDLPMYER